MGYGVRFPTTTSAVIMVIKRYLVGSIRLERKFKKEKEWL